MAPLTALLTSANQITIDFSGASLTDGQIYRGGFFTDTSIDSSMVDGASFLYLGLNEFDVQFDGFVTEAMADFAGGTVLNGEICSSRSMAHRRCRIGRRQDCCLRSACFCFLAFGPSRVDEHTAWPQQSDLVQSSQILVNLGASRPGFAELLAPQRSRTTASALPDGLV